VQFSLRGLLVLVAICSVWLGIAFHRAREQARVVALLGPSYNGPLFVMYDFNDLDEDARSPVPAWLIGALGIDFFHDVTAIAAWDGATDDMLKTIGMLPNVRSVLLHESSVTNDGLAHLKHLAHLEDLRIHSLSAAFDDEGLAQIATLRQLEQLDITSKNITDAGLRHLKRLTNLKSLVLGDTRITLAGVEDLQQALPDCGLYDGQLRTLVKTLKDKHAAIIAR
jgi:hypothetical protein